MVMYIIRLTHMRRAETSKPSRMKDVKADMLRRQGALHPNPEAVQDEAFRQEEFFDPRDLVQVRYEMLRRHQVDRDSVTEVATAFGVSRQAYYVTEAAFEKQGLPGLLPRRRGPRRAHKCTEEVLDFVEQQRAEGSPDQEVSEAVRKRFGISIHPRSLVRALTRQKKNNDDALRSMNVDQRIDWKQEYEHLRREALQVGSRRGHGLALFLSRGMMAWL
jgi:transposase